MRPWRRGPSEDDPRDRLLERLRPHVSDERVLAALRAVPRDRFVPTPLAEEAWDNVALPIGSGQTISQPLVVARMCELLALDGGERVLDVGTGSGYHAAVLARLAEHVWSIERHADLAALAAEALADAGVENVTLLVGDGAAGHPEARPMTRSTSPPRWASCRARSPTSSPTAGGWSGRSTPPTSGSSCLRRGGDGLERSDHERVRFVPLITDP